MGILDDKLREIEAYLEGCGEEIKFESGDETLSEVHRQFSDISKKMTSANIRRFFQENIYRYRRILSFCFNEYKKAVSKSDVEQLPLLIFMLGEFWTAVRMHELFHSELHLKRLHEVGSGEGGKMKAKLEKERKRETIAPLLNKLEAVRLSGKYRSVRHAVNDLLYNDDQFSQLLTDVDPANGTPWISLDKFLIPEAKKVWDDCVKNSKPK